MRSAKGPGRPVLFRLRFRKGKVERCAAANDAFSPTPATMTANNPIHVGQPNTGAFEFFPGVKALKNAKQLISLFHVETGSVVADKDHVFI